MERQAIAVRADVSVAADVKRMVEEVEDSLGSIDILVNNAAIARPRKLEEITEEEWDEMLTVNLKSVFLVTQAVIGGMRQRKWGRIINLSSVAAQTGRGCRTALRSIEGRDHRTDAFLRFSIREGWDHGQRHRSRAR